MADKEITMVLNVNLECPRCNKKIRRVLHKMKNKVNIKTTFFYEKKHEVTISGPFDANKVSRKLWCEAGQIINEIKEKEKKERPRAEVPEVHIDLRPLLEKVVEGPKSRPQPGPCRCTCACTCAKPITPPPAQGMVAAVAAPASSVSGHGHEAPSYYGVPVYSIEGWY